MGDPVDLVRVLAVAACLPIFLLAPGYAILTARAATPSDGIVYGPAITIAIVAATVLAAIGVGVPAAVASWSIVLGLTSLTVALTLAGKVPRPDGQAMRPIVLMLIVYAFLVGFDLVPSNPSLNKVDNAAPVPPTTYVVDIENPRVPNRGGDGTLQYEAEQVIWHRFVPAEGQFHGPWRFADRTPLAGFVAAGLAAPPGAAPPITNPGSPLGPRSDDAVRNRDPQTAPASPSAPEPIDSWGYWFYRLLMMALSLLVLLTVFRLASDLFDQRAATLAVVAAGLAPALMLSAYFTSPKNLAAYLGMVAALLVRDRRPWLAGLAVGGAYLAHPLGLLLGGAVVVYQAVKSRAGALKMVLAVMPAVLAWNVYGAVTGVRSSLITSALGCFFPGPSVHVCWEQFTHDGIAVIVWDRFRALAGSILPVGLVTPLSPSGFEAARFKWYEIHDFSYAGLVGLLFFGLVVLGLVRAFPRYRLEMGALLGVQALLIMLAWGTGTPNANIAGIGMLPLLFVFGGYGLSTLPARVGSFALFAMTVEGTLYFASLIAPVPDVIPLAYVLMAVICIGSVGALVATGFAVLRRRAAGPV